jgi:hypothetical protein
MAASERHAYQFSLAILHSFDVQVLAASVNGYRISARYRNRFSVFIFHINPLHLSVVAIVEFVAIRRRGD